MSGLQGVLRINFSGGWVSERTAGGAICFEVVDSLRSAALADECLPPAAASSQLNCNASDGIRDFSLMRTEAGFGMQLDDDLRVASFTTSGTVAEIAGVPLGSKIMAVNGKTVKDKSDVVAELNSVSVGETAAFALQPVPVSVQKEPVRSNHSAPDKTAEQSNQQVCTSEQDLLGTYKCVRQTQVRTAIEYTSGLGPTLEAGERIEALEAVITAAESLEIKFSYVSEDCVRHLGWITAKTSEGATIFEMEYDV